MLEFYHKLCYYIAVACEIHAVQLIDMNVLLLAFNLQLQPFSSRITLLLGKKLELLL